MKALLFLLLATACSAQTVIKIDDGTGHQLGQKVQSLSGVSKTIEWPGNNGTSGYVLSTNGANPALLSWIPVSATTTNAVLTNPASLHRNYILPTGDYVGLSIQQYPSGLNDLFDLYDGSAFNFFQITAGQVVGIQPTIDNTIFEITPFSGGTSAITQINGMDAQTHAGIWLNKFGGTGIDASGVTDGQLLIGGTSGHTFALGSLTAGSGITITPGAHSITIAATGGATDFVKTDPATTLDNTIVPSADITELTIREYSGGNSSNLLNITNSANTANYFYVSPTKIATQTGYLDLGGPILGNPPSQIQFDGNVSYYGILTTTSGLSTVRTWTLPDATGTIALTSDIPSGSSYIKNQTSAQASSNFYVQNTSNPTAKIESTNSGATATALTLIANTTNGSSPNQGLTFNVANGASNYDMVGTSANWLMTSAGALTLGSALTVPNGGTGRTSLTAHNVLTGNGTSGINSVAPGTSGNLLTSDGTDWISAAPTASYTVAQTIEIDNINTTSTDALTLKNTTASTNSTPQWSPRARLSSTTWSGSASVVADWIAENQTAVTANDQSDYVLSKGLAGTYIQELRIATDNGGTAPTFTFGGQSSGTQGAGAILVMGKTPSATVGGGDCFINGQDANGTNQFGGNYSNNVGRSTGNKDGQSYIVNSSFKGGSGSSLNARAKLLTLTPVTTGTYQVANATFGNNTGPIGAKIIMAEVTVVSSNAGITIPDATMVTIQPAATVPFAITMPTGVTGAWLIIFNNSAQPTTGTVIAAGATNSFVYLQGAWQHIN